MLRPRSMLWLLTALTVGCQDAPAQPRPRQATTPQRVIALAPSLTEIAADLGAAGQLVGLSSYGRVPPGAEKAARVGGFIDPSIEGIIALRPELVLGVPIQHRALESCRTAGLQTLEISCQTIEDALRAYSTLGRALGHVEAAEAARRRLHQGLEAERSRAAGRRRPRTLMLLGQAGQDLQQVYPVGPGNFAHQLLEIAGGRNVLESDAPSISTESVITLAPEVIIEVSMDEEGEPAERHLTPSPLWSRLPSVPAVATHRVFAVSSPALLQPGPRMVEGAELLAQLLRREERALSSSP